MLSPADQLALQYHVEHCEKPNFLDRLHKKQRKFILDSSPRQTGDWGRRSGKTTTNGYKIIKCAKENPSKQGDSIIGFMSTTKSHAFDLMWGRMEALDEELKLGLRFNITKGKIFFPNGCQLWILGADKPHDWQKLRGFAYRMIIIDEAQAIRGTVDKLINETLDPALSDYNGQLVLTGTPGCGCAGFFYKAATGQLGGWSNHHGNILDNKYFPAWAGRPDWEERARSFLEKKLADNHWDEDHPSYQREWLGRWVRDEGGLVYKYDRERNSYYGELPAGYNWRCVLGVDLGFDDPFAMHIWWFCDEVPELYGGETFHKSGLIPSQWAELIREWQSKYKPLRTVADSGALGKAIVKELVQRHGIQIHPAEKKDKFSFIELMNSDIRSGLIKVDPDGPLAQEWELLQLCESGRLLEDSRFQNDCADAALYAWREAKHWIQRPREEKPTVGTDKFHDFVAAKLRRDRERNIRKMRK